MSRLLRGTLLSLALAFTFTALPAKPDRTFQTSPTLALEIRTLVNLLEQVHYNRDGVKPDDYSEIIPNYMGDLDGQKLFFLDSDKQDFTTRYKADVLYWNLMSLGKIEPAYEVFTTYETRVTDRVAWILAQLGQDINLTGQDTYQTDRSKADWPATAAAADELWSKRLKFEILQEVLNKKTIEEAKANVRKRYERMLKNLADLDSKDLSEMFLATVARLYDPHSTYFSADTYEDFSIQMRLQLVGIGALLSLEEDQCIVKEIIPGGPADLNKQIKPNDKIIAVAQDGAEPVEVIGMKLRKIVEMIRGTKGTKVRLIIEPAAGATSATRKEVTLVRDVVNLDSARAHAAIFEVPDAEGKITPIGVITLPAFYGPDTSGDEKDQKSATKDIAELIKRLQAAKIQGLVLDLRRNGGGLLSEAISLTGLFIKSGPVVQVRSYYGDVKVDNDDDPDVAYNGPLAVLVSRFSASASEIVAGALQNYGRAVVIGDSSTHGKGTVQTIIEMKNVVPALSRSPIKTGATKLTVQKFYLPNGASTQLKGVVPDIVLPSVDDYLPIGEADLPHALVWDVIKTSAFDGKPLTPTILTPLRAASVTRQSQLPEFDFLRRSIDWFKTKRDQKNLSLNLEDRRKQKEIDATFKKDMDSERKQLAQADFKFNEVMLAPPPPPRIKAEKTEDEEADADDNDPEENERYAKMDIPLREALRVVDDVIRRQIDLTPAPAAIERAPHTALLAPVQPVER